MSKIQIDKKILKELYWDKNLTPQKISVIFDCNLITIRNRLKEFGIPLKDPAFARTRFARKDFDNIFTTKAYMIAFRLGDLNVYRPSLKSQTIVVRCHTTQKDQIDIIEGLFGGYGRVRTSLNNGHYNINCFLNNTFDFLIPKNNSAWEWLKNDNSLMPHFIAGYVDAEGNFILNQNRARFKIDSYDTDILAHISNWLTGIGINNKFRKIYSKGDPWNGAFPLSKDLWRLNINDMVSLQKFDNLIFPLIRHKKRAIDMVMCLENITERQNKKYESQKH